MLLVPPPVVSFAVDRLADVDYTVANRVTEGVAAVVHGVYAYHLPPQLAVACVSLLRGMDDVGGALIALVLWLAQHSV